LEESVRWASEVKTVAMPLFTAVVGWKDGEGLSGVGVGVVDSEDSEEEVVVVVSVVDVSVEADDDDDDVEVAAAVLSSSSPVDSGAGPFPSTLFGHRKVTPLPLKNKPINVSGLACRPTHAVFMFRFTMDKAVMHCNEQTPLPSEMVIWPVTLISEEVQSSMSRL
jgi:hypothetical protein